MRRPGDRSVVTPGADRFDDMTFQVCPLRFGREYRAADRACAACQRWCCTRTRPASRWMAHARPRRESAWSRLAATGSWSPRNCSLAGGGIENPRSLLASRDGRAGWRGQRATTSWAATHRAPHVPIGLLRCRQTGMASYGARRDGGIHIRGGAALSERAAPQRRPERFRADAFTTRRIRMTCSAPPPSPRAMCRCDC